MAEQTATQERPRVVDGAGPAFEMTQHLADANQRIFREWTELSASALRETARAYADALQSNLDLVRELQASTVRWNPFWPEAFTDPFGWYHRTLAEAADGMQRTFQAATITTRAALESFERLQRSAEQTGRRVQETLGSTAARTRESGRRAA